MLRTTLSHRIWPVAADANLLRNVTLALIGTLMLALAAQISVPFPLVPLTLQTLAVLVIGAVYGSKLGALTVLLYIGEGALGLPVFAEMKFGPAVLLGPTGGYLLGFVLAAAMVGWLAERGWDRSMPQMLGATLLGAAIIYVPGLLWLGTFVGGMRDAVAAGLLPFVWGDLIKAVVAALGVSAAWKLIGRQA